MTQGISSDKLDEVPAWGTHVENCGCTPTGFCWAHCDAETWIWANKQVLSPGQFRVWLKRPDIQDRIAGVNLADFL